LKSYEKESLLKSFVLFFSVQLIFLSIVIYQHYHKVLHEYEMHIGNKIMQCHLNKKCKDFKRTIVKDVENKKMHTFYKESEVYMLFKSENSYVKMSISLDEYIKNRHSIQEHVMLEYFLYLLALILESFLFALYAIRPLKKALQLNEEFVKDILHDFNTPLSALKINLKILTKKFGGDEAISRSDEAIQSILSLQENLHYYIKQSKLQNETIQLDTLLKKRISYFEALYPNIDFTYKPHALKVFTNKDALLRVIDNLLSNAGKYNKKDGSVIILMSDTSLTIQDTGRGIENPKKIFERYYKENETGIGIGLHIVKKLCDELNISISLSTTLGTGSQFTLDFSNIIATR